MKRKKWFVEKRGELFVAAKKRRFGFDPNPQETVHLTEDWLDKLERSQKQIEEGKTRPLSQYLEEEGL